MLTYFNEGGALFMGMLSIVLLLILAVAVKSIVKGDGIAQLHLIKSLGLFALVLGFLGQFIGLFSAFSFIAEAGTISPAILANGLKVSSITSIYGMIIFLVAYFIWFVLNGLLKKNNK